MVPQRWGYFPRLCMNSKPSNVSGRKVVLKDGTPGIVRPIVPEDRWALADALEDLAEDSRGRRFLFNKTRLSEKELRRLSNPDGIDHIAFGLAVESGDDGGMLPIAVARCFRDPDDPEMAEIAFVTADPWHGLGAGAELMRSLSAASSGVGIRLMQSSATKLISGSARSSPSCCRRRCRASCRRSHPQT